MIVVTIMFIALGLVGYTTFGEATKVELLTNILDEFGLKDHMKSGVVVISVFVMVNALCSYPLQALAAFDIIESHRFFTDGNIKMKKILVRTFIVLLGTFIASLMHNPQLFIEIVGGISASMVCFVLPSLMYLKEYGIMLNLKQILMCYGFMLIGGALGIYSVISSLGLKAT